MKYGSSNVERQSDKCAHPDGGHWQIGAAPAHISLAERPEHTVIDWSGKTFQVDCSYQRYFINKNDGSYVGGDIRMDLDQLRSLGLDPDNYEEAQIKQ